MIPADVATRLRLILPDLPAPPHAAVANQQLSDALGDLVPGQRVMAEIQALLPNGSYRASIAQRDITLALPFSAKPGDSLELEVVEHEGRRAFSLVDQRSGGGRAATGDAALPARAARLDVLADLVPGQRVMAQIQTALPNNIYRALIGQRDVTLALPFPAKAGDNLELEVVDSGGKLTLAVVANRGEAGAPPAGDESVPTTLSRTGRMIGDLLGGIGEEGKRAQPAPLNGNQPVVTRFPDNPAELVPVLRDALAKSGMFYESHQARWVAGALPQEALLQEPQGRLSVAAQPAAQPAANPPASSQPAAAQPPAATREALPPAGPETHPDAGPASRTGVPPGLIAPELTPLVQQQLDALATQNFVWQGQIWPGQQMRWEIEDSLHRPAAEAGDENQQWQTRLHLALPRLGGIDATLRLRADGGLEIAITAGDDAGRQALAGAGNGLGRQLADAGLRLTALSIEHGKTAG